MNSNQSRMGQPVSSAKKTCNQVRKLHKVSTEEKVKQTSSSETAGSYELKLGLKHQWVGFYKNCSSGFTGIGSQQQVLFLTLKIFSSIGSYELNLRLMLITQFTIPSTKMAAHACPCF